MPALAVVMGTVVLWGPNNPGFPVWVLEVIGLPLAIVLHHKARYSICMFLSCAIISLNCAGRIGAEHVWPSERWSIQVPARVEGSVVSVMRLANSIRYVIKGEVDMQCAPCCLATVVVYEKEPAVFPVVGQTRLAFGILERGSKPTLPGEIDDRTMLAGQGASFALRRAKSSVVQASSYFNVMISRFRSAVISQLDTVLPPEASAVSRALILGDRSGISSEQRKAYAASGTAHMFSVSGAHVAIVASMFVFVLGMAPRLWKVFLLISAIALFVIVTGAQPPAIRAGVMGALAIWGRYAEKTVLGVNFLCLSVFILTVIEPGLLNQPGAILSVCATASIIVCMPAWLNCLQRVSPRPRPITKFLFAAWSVSAAATIGTSIPSAYFFEQVSLSGPLLNMIIVPLLTVVMILTVGILCITPLGIQEPLCSIHRLLVTVANSVTEHGGMSVSNFDQTTVVLVAGCITIALMWPLVSSTRTGLLTRLILGSCLAVTVGILSEHRVPTTLTAQRRHGIVLAKMDYDTCRILFVGRRIAPIDYSALQWVQKQQTPLRVYGAGAWGRRMRR